VPRTALAAPAYSCTPRLERAVQALIKRRCRTRRSGACVCFAKLEGRPETTGPEGRERKTELWILRSSSMCKKVAQVERGEQRVGVDCQAYKRVGVIKGWLTNGE
jgi:hypothetical protein